MGFTIIMVTIGFANLLAAWTVGRFGARANLFVGGVAIAVVTALMGTAGHIYGIYLAICFFIGLGVSLASALPAQTVIISWFNARRALALGLVLGGGAIGGFFAPQIISAAVQFAGGNWRIGWFIISAAAIAGAAVAILAVCNRPDDMGQYPDGLTPDEAGTASTSRPIRTYRTPFQWTLSRAIRTRSLWFLIIGMALSFTIWQIVITQGPFHLRDRGFDAAEAAFFYSLTIGLSIVGRFTIAALGDIIEPRFLLAWAALCSLLGGILFWFVSPDIVWTAYLYPLLVGCGFGAGFVCMPTIIGNYWGTDTFPGIYGLLSPVTMAFQAVAAPLAGLLYDLQGTYFTAMLIACVGAAAGFTLLLLCTPPKPKEAVNKTV